MNVRGVKGKAKKKKLKTEPDNKAQSERFLRAARSLGIKDSQAFERAMDALAPRKQGGKK
jgi:hypothetical protein